MRSISKDDDAFWYVNARTEKEMLSMQHGKMCYLIVPFFREHDTCARFTHIASLGVK